MTQTERITYYEGILDRLTAAAADLDRALAEFEAVRPLARELEGYYGSEAWRRDYEDDEAGRLSPELKRGVLSQDGVYDALAEDRELLARLLETAARIVRG